MPAGLLLPVAPLTARSVVLNALLGMRPPELPVRSLVRIGAEFGIAERTVRVACSRMVADGDLAGVAELQPWFTRRLRDWLAERGRVAIGWDEINDRGPIGSMVCMAWRGPQYAAAAAAAEAEAKAKAELEARKKIEEEKAAAAAAAAAADAKKKEEDAFKKKAQEEYDA